MLSRTCSEISEKLHALADAQKAHHAQRFFKTGPGEYAEGDRFLGITVPQVRRVAGAYFSQPPESLLPLLQSPWHEERLCCLVVWCRQYERAKAREQKSQIFDLYLANRNHINNWDLVDISAPKIAGNFLHEAGDSAPLASLLASESLWDRRIAILSTWAWIKADDVSLTLRFAECLLRDPEPLLHKAVGWMLREAAKRKEKDVLDFLTSRGSEMPRTMLRYAIERFEPSQRKFILHNTLPAPRCPNAPRSHKNAHSPLGEVPAFSNFETPSRPCNF